MALSWYQELSLLSKTVVILGTGVAVFGGTYFISRHLRGRVNKSTGNGDIVDNPEKRVLVLGLDGAGKSSLLKCLSHQEGDGRLEPTEGFNVMCIQAKNTTLNVWEVGGKQSVRSYWENFMRGTKLLVFVVDCADDARVEEAKEELHKLLKDSRLAGVPLLVVANKQDLPGAMKGGHFLEALDLVLPVEGRDVHLLEICSHPERKSDNICEVLDLMSTLSRK